MKISSPIAGGITGALKGFSSGSTLDRSAYEPEFKDSFSQSSSPLLVGSGWVSLAGGITTAASAIAGNSTGVAIGAATTMVASMTHFASWGANLDATAAETASAWAAGIGAAMGLTAGFAHLVAISPPPAPSSYSPSPSSGLSGTDLLTDPAYHWYPGNIFNSSF